MEVPRRRERVDAGDLRGVDGEEHGECEADEDGGGVEGEVGVEGWHGHDLSRWRGGGGRRAGPVGGVTTCQGIKGEKGEDGDKGRGEEVHEC